MQHALGLVDLRNAGLHLRRGHLRRRARGIERLGRGGIGREQLALAREIAHRLLMIGSRLRQSRLRRLEPGARRHHLPVEILRLQPADQLAWPHVVPLRDVDLGDPARHLEAQVDVHGFHRARGRDGAAGVPLLVGVMAPDEDADHAQHHEQQERADLGGPALRFLLRHDQSPPWGTTPAARSSEARAIQ